MHAAQLGVYTQPFLTADFDAMKKRVPKTVSLDPDTLKRGLERAALFRITFSRHVERLIEEDYLSGKTKIVLVAEPPTAPAPG